MSGPVSGPVWPGARVRNQELTCSTTCSTTYTHWLLFVKMTWLCVIKVVSLLKKLQLCNGCNEEISWKHHETPPMPPPFWEFHLAPPTQQVWTWRCQWHNFLTLTCSLCLVIPSFISFLCAENAPRFEIAELHRTSAAKAAWRTRPAQSALAIIWTECGMRTRRIHKVLLIDLRQRKVALMNKYPAYFKKKVLVNMYMQKGMYTSSPWEGFKDVLTFPTGFVEPICVPEPSPCFGVCPVFFCWDGRGPQESGHQLNPHFWAKDFCWNSGGHILPYTSSPANIQVAKWLASTSSSLPTLYISQSPNVTRRWTSTAEGKPGVVESSSALCETQNRWTKRLNL